MKKSYKKIVKITNAIEPATSLSCWGKSPYKRYKGVAGKGGKTMNYGGGADA